MNFEPEGQIKCLTETPKNKKAKLKKRLTDKLSSRSISSIERMGGNKTAENSKTSNCPVMKEKHINFQREMERKE